MGYIYLDFINKQFCIEYNVNWKLTWLNTFSYYDLLMILVTDKCTFSQTQVKVPENNRNSPSAK